MVNNPLMTTQQLVFRVKNSKRMMKNMEEVEEIDNGGGVGAFLAPTRQKRW